MKNLLVLAIFLFVISTIVSAGYFTPTINYLLSLTEKCIENDVFYEELFSVETGITWADVVFMPSVALKKFDTLLVEDNLLGFLVFKIHKDTLTEPVILITIQEVSVGGVTTYGSAVTSGGVDLYLLTDSYFAELESSYGTYADIATDKEFLIMVVYANMTWSKPIILNLTTATSKVLWRIKPDSKDLIKLKELVSE